MIDVWKSVIRDLIQDYPVACFSREEFFFLLFILGLA